MFFDLIWPKRKCKNYNENLSYFGNLTTPNNFAINVSPQRSFLSNSIFPKRLVTSCKSSISVSLVLFLCQLWFYDIFSEYRNKNILKHFVSASFFCRMCQTMTRKLGPLPIKVANAGAGNYWVISLFFA